MAKTQISIKLIRTQTVYTPGTWIEGIVSVMLHKELQARAIRLSFFGEESTHWEKRTGKKRTSYNQRYDLWTTCLTLWGYSKGSNSKGQSLAAGSYAFPFCMQIPAADSLPASVKFANGHVRYALSAYIDIPFGFDVRTEYTITLLPPVPINAMNAQLNAALELEKDHSVGCCFCVCCACYGHVMAQMRCVNPLVVPGQPIYCTAKINNGSKLDVTGVELWLENHLSFRAFNSKTTAAFAVTSAQQSLHVASGQKFSNLNFSLPDTKTDADPKGPNVLNAEAGYNDNTVERGPRVGQGHKAGPGRPFTLEMPPTLPPTFSGHLISSSYQLVVRLYLSGSCTPDARFTFNVAAAPTVQSAPATSAASSTTTRTPVHLHPLSSGEHKVYCAFDGMKYRHTDQFDNTKPVAYPCFYDTQPNIIPPSLDSFNASWRTLLAGGS